MRLTKLCPVCGGRCRDEMEACSSRCERALDEHADRGTSPRLTRRRVPPCVLVDAEDFRVGGLTRAREDDERRAA